MNVLWVSKGKPEGSLTPEQKKAFTEANTLFVGAVIGTLVDCLQDVYLHHTDAKVVGRPGGRLWRHRCWR
jgi:hypothetical protein